MTSGHACLYMYLLGVIISSTRAIGVSGIVGSIGMSYSDAATSLIADIKDVAASAIDVYMAAIKRYICSHIYIYGCIYTVYSNAWAVFRPASGARVIEVMRHIICEIN